jgi:hypothetical protein
VSALVRAAVITSRCARTGCGHRFEQPPDLLLKGHKQLYCGDECGRLAAPDCYCEACGKPRDVDRPAYGCLPICRDCRQVAWWSCWRKRSFPDFYTAKQWTRVYAAAGRLRRPLTPYSCVLCDRWHNSSWNPWDEAPPALQERLTDLAVLFQTYGFDIDIVRGYANNPNGTHEISEDDWRVPEDILALIE